MPIENDACLMIKPPDSAAYLETKESDPPNFVFNLILEHQLATAAVRTIEFQRSQHMPYPHSMPLDQANFLGQHVMAEFKNVSPNYTADELERIIVKAAQLAGATILHHAAFNEYPNGDISALVVLAESHGIMHYMPEEGILALDFFTCGLIGIKKAIDYIQSQLNLDPYDSLEVKRGIRQNSDSRFVNGIATVDNFNQLRFFRQRAETPIKPGHVPLGRHALAEFNFCDSGRINDGKHVNDTFEGALKVGGAPITTYTCVHPFDMMGITTLRVGQRKHSSTHNYPEFNFAAVDVCSFDPKLDLDKTLTHMTQEFQAFNVARTIFPRAVFNRQTRDFDPALKLCRP